jgi:acetylornithine deacetylase/succinyl-diaminopimelate desuccinylase-like protein
MNSDALNSFVEKMWRDSILPELESYIRIPNKSPAFDPEWRAHGHIDRAVAQYEAWARRAPIADARVEVLRLENRTPVLLIDIPGQSDDCILLYGHLDKQPEMSGWRDGLDPWTPVREGDRLYGRGSADDGYAMFACLTAIAALQAGGVAHARCVILIEGCEESGSYDLPAYIEHLAPRLGNPSLVIALDSGCESYDRLWCTTSLRGLVGGTLTVEVMTEGIHSGSSGAVADSFRIARAILSRLEDEKTGAIIPREFHVPIPENRVHEAKLAGDALGTRVFKQFPLAGTTRPVTDDAAQAILNYTWRPALAVVGADGLPPAQNAGNVLRPYTTLKISMRIPPECDANAAARALRSIVESDPPYNARVTFKGDWAASGWNAPPLRAWLARALDGASNAAFGKSAAFSGVGGTIPFMAMLGERYPEAQFVITGVLGPGSNAHGPNEFLHIPMGIGVTQSVARLIASHFTRG